MIKKIIQWVWRAVCWPFRKFCDWLKSSLPRGK
jgi:hypothetical protein